MSKAALLVNLGTPRSPSVRDVRRYLNEFLMDPYVLTAPWPVRRLIVSGFILPFRPRRSAVAYASIWTEEGSPLLRHTERLGQAVGDRAGLVCMVAMRYGEPSIAAALAKLQEVGCTELLLVPLFPQHADSTRTTAIEAIRQRLPAGMKLEVLPPFHQRPDYIDCQVRLLERHLPADWDHLLLSYHGLPEQHITKADPTGRHCLADEHCCECASPAHATCYRHQCYETARALAARLGSAVVRVGEAPASVRTGQHQPTACGDGLNDASRLAARPAGHGAPPAADGDAAADAAAETVGLAAAIGAQPGCARGQVSVSFQSRLGRLPWLRPYTDQVLAELPGRGIRRLAVYCPSFVADNLETLEEIGIQGRETFLQAGGETLTLIPCLNVAPDWVEALANWIG